MNNQREDILKTKDGSHIAYITYEDCLILEKYFAKVKELEQAKETQNKIVKENSEEYVIKTNELSEFADKKTTHNKHDKLFKDLFGNKQEVAKFINTYLDLTEVIVAEQLEKYSNSYITKMYEDKEADIVYKLKNENVFFLIEHQSTVDRTMPWRISNYVIEIMNSAVDKTKIRNKDYKYPKVISIVLYTGRKKWDVSTNLENIQKNILKHNQTIQIYNLVDINTCNNEKLLNDDMLISKAMLIEKAKNKEEIVKSFKAIIESLKKLKIPEGDHLINVMQNYMLNDVLDSKDKTEIEKMLEKNEGGDIMLNCARVINEENARLVRQGKLEGVKQGVKQGVEQGVKQGRLLEKRNLIINMLKNNFTDAQIKIASGINDKELEKIKKELEV